jgi:hypothetical protein
MIQALRRSALTFGVAAAWGLTACSAIKSADPLSPTVAGPIPGVNITAPAPVQPAQGARVSVGQQPVTLTVTNASTTGVRPLNYLFEVASDAGFTNAVFMRTGMAPGSGETSLTLPTPLATGQTYYWHSRAQDGANTGPYSAIGSFSVYTPIVIQAPVPVAPGANALNVSLTPTFSFTDAARSGPVGPITYQIEVALDSAFSNRIAVWTPAEQPNQTQSASPQALTYTTVYYWHVRAADPTTVGPWSATLSFQTIAAPVVVAPVPAPVPVPTGPTGAVPFDHPWTGNVELQLRALLVSGLAGANGLNGQAVINQMNALGGIYAGGEFQQHHDGPTGFPTYGFPWFYVSYITNVAPNYYQIVEFGTPPPGD